ncbi:MAG: hypothetical protein ACK4ME_01635 [Fimbriimonadales bacterium]
MIELLGLVCFLGIIGLLVYQSVQHTRANERERRAPGAHGGNDGSCDSFVVSSERSESDASEASSSGYEGGFSDGGGGGE